MIEQDTITNRILDVVRQVPDCTLDELTRNCPDLPWNQIFLEVDRLSRAGELRLTSKGVGNYTVRLRINDYSAPYHTAPAAGGHVKWWKTLF
jgi:hypothetical protein